jgi:hypothetical protein
VPSAFISGVVKAFRFSSTVKPVGLHARALRQNIPQAAKQANTADALTNDGDMMRKSSCAKRVPQNMTDEA